MRTPSLGWQSHLIFPRFDGEIEARDDCLVVRTPGNPTFWWGNFLLFDHAPQPGDAARWTERFDSEVAARVPGARHVALGVDADERFALPHDFVEAGFEMYTIVFLTLEEAALCAPNVPLAEGFEAGVLDLPKRLDELVELQVRTDRQPDGDVEGYRRYRTQRMRRYAEMEAAGLGHWFGVSMPAEPGAPVVADGGLFHGPESGGSAAVTPRDLGRFQHVSTQPEWRRRGLCAALIHAACRHGFEQMGLTRLVIAADPDDIAIRIYERLGFVRRGLMHDIQRRPGGV
jgi:RimJ/RimL family protein N-acetyltransferase